ncbi:hypothetical protein BNKMLPFJ_00003 [Escherichia phage vB_EcoS-26175IV]|uniref:Uncharacterized protein n=1 Tax=Escherichia phage vB_EcoS-26175I TaxID=2576478 RepID=A0A5P1M780_9CAUD|nr:hypothetical protein HEDJPLGI_00171 [Escherichia phage vB_EcoS-26175I]QDK00140.1 hypothetical protein EGCEDKNN_00060 [Escherichia phage vB_EcoS-26175II]QDK00339.1 hypothetical protein INCEGHDL_00132 [Escherichia phage vB_EcoS-26175III]QDK00399.1 hypothetical protein BNKMLPFJ_00003 [Escherichia phage vB_EcoS-26175IV]QDK00636.1 hypothetical protein JOHFDMOO_00113 [Escherichia phage vB_EcoS-26175V]
MKKIKISPLKPLPYIGQSLVLSWEEKLNGEKVRMVRQGYKLISLAYEANTLVADIYSPITQRVGRTTYLCLCKNFTWQGDTIHPKAYEVQ